MKNTILYAMIMVFLIGCKEYQAPELEPSNDPIFYFEGSVDGASKRLAVDGNFSAFSTYAVDSLGVTYYEGGLKKCDNCLPEFNFKWRASSEANPSLTETVSESSPRIRSASGIDSVEVYMVELTAATHSNVTSYRWTALGEVYTTPSIRIEVLASDYQKFAVQLEVKYEGGCNAQTLDTVYLPNHGCDARAKGTAIANDLIQFKATGLGGDGYSYLWKFENGEQIPSKEITYQYATPPADGVDEIYLDVNTGNCKATRRYNHFFPNAGTGCAVNMNYTISRSWLSVPAVISPDLNTIEIEYVGQNGKLYSSFLAQQDESSSFKVESVESFIDPYLPADQESMKVDARFTGWLSDGVDAIKIENAHFVIPIGKGAN